MKLNQLDLNKLKTFEVVYRQGTIQDTANELNITSSAVSQSLKALETDLKSQLFLRTPKGLLPTETAKVLHNHTHSFLNEIASVYSNIRDKDIEPEGLLRIGAPADFVNHKLVKKIKQFRKSHPRVSFKVVYGSQENILNHLLRNELDFAFLDDSLGLAKHKSQVISTKVFESELVLCASRKFFEEYKANNAPFCSEPQVSNLIF